MAELCAVEGCDQPRRCKEWCAAHYARWKRQGDPLRGGPIKQPGPEYCIVEDCEAKAHGQGLCAMHYARFKRHGDPTHRERDLTKGPPEVRFWAKVKVGEAHECWPWTASVFKDRYGYGKFQAGQGIGKGNVVYAHRYAYHLTRQMPLDLHILHSCDNPICVNPAHLHAGTHTDNMREMVARGRDQWTRGTRRRADH